MRESLFGALESADLITDATVLDLFAGSGALGLEAASRGASSVDFVERAPKAATVVDRNCHAIARSVSGTRLRVHRASAEAFLRAASGTWDLIFIDPPYDQDDDDLARVLELLVPRLSDDSVVVLERSNRSPAPPLPGGLAVERSKKYGDTVLWWLSRS